MADKKTAPVENFRLTKEQMKFQRRFGDLKKIQEMLQARSIDNMQESENLREMWQMLEGEFQMLQPPQESVKEMEGMNFQEEGMPMAPDRFQLKY